MEENKTIEEFLEEAPPVDEQARVSRRKFLTGAVAGGAAGLPQLHRRSVVASVM